MKVLAFAASSSKASINKALVTHAAMVLKQELAVEAEVEVIDLNAFEMPIFSSDREAAWGIPDDAKAFFKKIGSADALIVSYAEHNGNYTAAFKNIFDWASRIDKQVFQGKPMVALGTSPGPSGAKNVLKLAVESAPHFGAELRGSLSVPFFGKNFDKESRQLVNEQLAAELRALLKTLV
ncbi:NADPH-dependent FMN reductase [Reinekea marinisedimentorum]|uniref:NADPH-dependent FMN reductase n=1 Tax=Reinekea marinisedimentorum TaxID=230495 RepID=A0A4R3IDZ5_9GAMM|nr:NAD(P)H-dependent oxidoreductase [Reinekea marinisedimentorum]TCS43808.1 NADPH-dependent FMN reductase [Reinekea marinisedimentorum]